MVDEQYLLAFKPHMIDAWQIRHQFMHVLCGDTTVNDLIFRSIGKKVGEDDLKAMRYLLAAQYERQRMYTSCGWFFDDFDRIEPRNNVAYAAQAVWLTEIATGIDLSSKVRPLLKNVSSWRTRLQADIVFDQHISRVRQFQTSTLGRLFLDRL